MSQQRVFFQTYGCKVNQYDTQAIREQCQRLGLAIASDDASAEVYVINTCSVTEDADREALRRIRWIRRRRANVRIIVTGCLVDRKLKHLAGVDAIVPTRQKDKIAELIADPQRLAAFQPCFEGGYSRLAVSEFSGHTRAFVKIQDGCNYACSFCKIPQVRGRSVSRPFPEIVEEARRLVASGYRELVLTGISLGHYGKEWTEGPELADVVETLASLAGLARLRLSSIEPSDVTQRLLSILAERPTLCRHLHLPLQSGSERLLKLMRRQYTAQAYRDLVERARQRIPALRVTTDVIVGFPTETDDDVEQTEALLEHLQILRTHFFPYSVRRSTWASTLAERVALPTIRQRMDRLRTTQAARTSRCLESLIGTELEVLVEHSPDRQTGYWEGYSETYVKCLIQSPQILRHQLIRVRVTQACVDHVLAHPL